MNQTGKFGIFRDIYSGESLETGFSIDHFLPWTFVAHDQIWNLAPVSANTNSRKGDSLPDADLYLPRLAALHWYALSTIREQVCFHSDYLSSFKENVGALRAGGEALFASHFKTLIMPQMQLAVNQGFQSGWRAC